MTETKTDCSFVDEGGDFLHHLPDYNGPSYHLAEEAVDWVLDESNVTWQEGYLVGCYYLNYSATDSEPQRLYIWKSLESDYLLRYDVGNEARIKASYYAINEKNDPRRSSHILSRCCGTSLYAGVLFHSKEMVKAVTMDFANFSSRRELPPRPLEWIEIEQLTRTSVRDPYLDDEDEFANDCSKYEVPLSLIKSSSNYGRNQ